MKKRVFASVFSCLCFAGAAAAAEPHVLLNGTGTGGMNVAGAEIAPQQGAATAWGAFFNQGGLVAPGDEVSRVRYGVGALYAPLEFLEVGAGVGGSRVTNSLSNPRQLDSFGDARVAAKGAYKINDTFSTGLRGELLLFSGVEGSSGYGDTASYAGEWVSTLRAGGFAAHLSLGYLYDRTVNFVPGTPTPQERFAWGQNGFNQALFGLAAAYETGFADYVVEVSGELPVGADAPALAASPLRATPGVRLRPWGPLEVQLAGNFALTDVEDAGLPAQPAYDILGALRWRFGAPAEAAAAQPTPAPAPAPAPPPAQEPAEAPPAVTPPTSTAPQFGAVTGRIVNMATGQPIGGAKVTVEGGDAAATSTPAGTYVLSNLPVGEVTLKITAEGMQAATQAATVKAEGLSSADVGLQPLVTTGTLTVRAADKNGKGIADAEVLVNGKRVGTTGADGALTATELDAGAQELVVRKAGFKTADPSFVEITAGQTATETVTLEPEARPGFVEVKVFNEERQPIAATLSVEGHPDLTRQLTPDAGSMTTLKVLPGSYRFRVEAQGYQPEVQTVDVAEDGEIALRFKLQK